MEPAGKETLLNASDAKPEADASGGGELSLDNIQSINTTPKSPRQKLSKLTIATIVVAAVILVVVTIGAYLIYYQHNQENKKPKPEKVLTIEDLNNPKTEVNSATSNASIDNLSKQLKAKIDKQITDKENPIDTVSTLIGVLCNSANRDRVTQCIDFITNFLDTKMDALKLNSDYYGQPNEARINTWRASLYASLVYNYQFIMINGFPGSDGKLWDTTAEQLKYIALYLAIAKDPANWGEPQTAADGHTWYFYTYPETDNFTQLQQQLENQQAAQTGGTE